MSNSDLYKQASRLKLRFESNKGFLSVEQLWEVPLTSPSGFCLDHIARNVNLALKDTGEGSFVEAVIPEGKVENELRLEILKDIIATIKLEERKAKQDEKTKAQEKQRLLEILAKKKDSALEELSVEEIQKRIEAL